MAAAPKAKHGRLSLDSSDAALNVTLTTKADKRLSLQIPKATAPPPAPSSSTPATPLGVLSKARASLDSLRLNQTIRPRLNSVTNGAVAAASAIGRAATPPVLSSLVGGGGGSSSNPASPSSEDSTAQQPRSVAELADRACMSRWEAKGKDRKVWRDEVNRVARERCIAAANNASSASLILGGGGGGGGGSSSGAPTPRSATPVGGGGASSRAVRKEGAASASPVTPPSSVSASPNVVYNTARQGLANLAVQNLGLTGTGVGAAPASEAKGRGSKDLARPAAANVDVDVDATLVAPHVESTTAAVAAGAAATAAAVPLGRRKSNRDRGPRLEGIDEASLGRNARVVSGVSRLGPGARGLVQPKAVRGVAA